MICRLAYKVCSSELHQRTTHVLYAGVVSKLAKKRPIHGASKRPHLNKVEKNRRKAFVERESQENQKPSKTTRKKFFPLRNKRETLILQEVGRDQNFAD